MFQFSKGYELETNNSKNVKNDFVKNARYRNSRATLKLILTQYACILVNTFAKIWVSGNNSFLL